MNAILIFPTGLSAELDQLRSEVDCHGHAIHLEAAAFAETRVVWVSQERDITRRMQTLRQRLTGLLKSLV
jgi:hypothetical protein